MLDCSQVEFPIIQNGSGCNGATLSLQSQCGWSLQNQVQWVTPTGSTTTGAQLNISESGMYQYHINYTDACTVSGFHVVDDVYSALNVNAVAQPESCSGYQDGIYMCLFRGSMLHR